MSVKAGVSYQAQPGDRRAAAGGDVHFWPNGPWLIAYADGTWTGNWAILGVARVRWLRFQGKPDQQRPAQRGIR